MRSRDNSQVSGGDCAAPCPLTNEEVLSHILGHERLDSKQLSQRLMVSECTIKSPKKEVVEYLCQTAKRLAIMP